MAEDLYSSMQKRMQAVQSGQPDPGNADLYGYNQTAPGATPPPVGSAPAGSATGGPITTAGQVANTTTTLGAQPQAGAPTTVASVFQQALVNKLGQNPGDVSAQSPEIKGAVDANKLALQRGAERDRAQLAVSSANDGTSASGGMNSQLQGINAHRAEAEGQYAGNAVAQLAQQRSNQIMQALAMGGQLLSEEERTGLQRELAQLDAQLRREGLNVQSTLGQGDLDLRSRLGEGGLNLNLLQTLLANQQSGNQLSANLGMFNASQGQQALLSLLGGL